jgi:hypothetical protein
MSMVGAEAVRRRVPAARTSRGRVRCAKLAGEAGRLRAARPMPEADETKLRPGLIENTGGPFRRYTRSGECGTPALSPGAGGGGARWPVLRPAGRACAADARRAQDSGYLGSQLRPHRTAVPPWLARNSWFDLSLLDPALAQRVTATTSAASGSPSRRLPLPPWRGHADESPAVNRGAAVVTAQERELLEAGCTWRAEPDGAGNVVTATRNAVAGS